MYKIQEGMIYSDGHEEWRFLLNEEHESLITAMKVADQYAFEEKGAWHYRTVNSNNNVIRTYYWHEGSVVSMNGSDRPMGLIFAQRQWDALIQALDDFEAYLDGVDMDYGVSIAVPVVCRNHLTTIRSLVSELKGE